MDVDTPYYIIATRNQPQSVLEALLYDHNKIVRTFGGAVIIWCPSRFYAEDQIGRFRSGLVGVSGAVTSNYHDIFVEASDISLRYFGRQNG